MKPVIYSTLIYCISLLFIQCKSKKVLPTAEPTVRTIEKATEEQLIEILTEATQPEITLAEEPEPTESTKNTVQFVASEQPPVLSECAEYSDRAKCFQQTISKEITRRINTEIIAQQVEETPKKVRAIVKFIINENGKIEPNMECMQGNAELCKEIIRALHNWEEARALYDKTIIPGKDENGKPMPVEYVLPVGLLVE